MGYIPLVGEEEGGWGKVKVFEVFGSIVPLVVLMKHCKCQEFLLKGKTEANFGQNTPKSIAP